jgi:hypothetical protein
MIPQFKVDDWKLYDEFSASGYFYAKPVLYKGRITKILVPLVDERFRIKYQEVKPGDTHDTVRDEKELYISAGSTDGILIFKAGKDALEYLDRCYQNRFDAAKAHLKQLKEEYHQTLGFEIPLEIVNRWLS